MELWHDHVVQAIKNNFLGKNWLNMTFSGKNNISDWFMMVWETSKNKVTWVICILFCHCLHVDKLNILTLRSMKYLRPRVLWYGFIMVLSCTFIGVRYIFFKFSQFWLKSAWNLIYFVLKVTPWTYMVVTQSLVDNFLFLPKQCCPRRGRGPAQGGGFNSFSYPGLLFAEKKAWWAHSGGLWQFGNLLVSDHDS